MGNRYLGVPTLWAGFYEVLATIIWCLEGATPLRFYPVKKNSKKPPPQNILLEVDKK